MSAVLKHYAIVSPNVWDILPPATGVALKGILDALNARIDLVSLNEVYTQFVTHIADENDPHNVVLGDVSAEIVDLIYVAYIDISVAPLSREDFEEQIVAPGKPLLELIRRIVLNSYMYIEGIGPNLTADPSYRDEGLLAGDITTSPTLAIRNRMKSPLLVQDGSSGSSGYHYLPISAIGVIPHPALSLMVKHTVIPTSGAVQNLFQIGNSTQSIAVRRRSTTSAVYEVILTNITQLHPAVGDQMVEFFTTIYPPIAASTPVEPQSYLVQYGYDPIPSSLGMISVEPVAVRVDGDYVGISVSQSQLSLFYVYQGEVRTVTVYISGVEPFTFCRFGKEFAAADVAGKIQGAGIWPEFFNIYTATDAFLSI